MDAIARTAPASNGKTAYQMRSARIASSKQKLAAAGATTQNGILRYTATATATN